MSDVKTEFLFDISGDLDREGTINLGATPQGIRLIVYVTRGTFEGPRMKGVVLPGGGDWYTTRPDGTGVVDARAGDHCFDFYRIDS